jgi:hypothetical protein
MRLGVDEEARRTLVNNERLKLLATFVNGLGIAMFAVGALAPTVSSLYAAGTLTPFAQIISIICVLSAFILHYAGSLVLRRLVP